MHVLTIIYLTKTIPLKLRRKKKNIIETTEHEQREIFKMWFAMVYDGLFQ